MIIHDESDLLVAEIVCGVVRAYPAGIESLVAFLSDIDEVQLKRVTRALVDSGRLRIGLDWKLREHVEEGL